MEAEGRGALAALDAPQRDALAYLALQLHHQELMVAEIFWGLWLFPFGICVMRSGFIPRFLGILLMIAGFGYVVDAFAELALPQFVHLTTRLTTFTNFCEVPIIFWLLIWGARPQRGPPTSRLSPDPDQIPVYQAQPFWMLPFLPPSSNLSATTMRRRNFMLL